MNTRFKLLWLVLIVALTLPSNNVHALGLAPAPENQTVLTAPARRDRLGPNDTLRRDEQLTSSNRRFSLIMQSDGNLVLYHNRGVGHLWASGTVGSGAVRAVMQSDGNLVLYTANNTPVWASSTVGASASLVVQNDGNLVMYREGNSVAWATNTVPFGLAPGEQLSANQKLVSTNRRFVLIMERDGNLELRTSWGKFLWSTQTSGTGANRAVMEEDGNLVLYTADNIPVWSSDLQGGRPAVLRLHGDGSFGIYRGQTRLGGIDAPPPERVLAPNQRLLPGDSIAWMLSRRTAARRLIMQSDGNLVLYDMSGAAVWASGTVGSGASYAVMQSDGNLVLYRTNNTAVWATNTVGELAILEISKPDGNLVIRRKSGAIAWSTDVAPPRIPVQ